MQSNEIESRTNLSKSNQLEMLCFKLTHDSVVFAVNVFKVRETVKFQRLTEIPDTNEAISGLLTLRYQVLPVVDLKYWLYNGMVPKNIIEKDQQIPDSQKQIIICEFNEVVIGIKVYKAEYILRRSWEDIMVPVTSEFGAKVNNYTKNDNGDIVYIVDIEQMLSDLFPEVGRQIEEELGNIEKFDFDVNKKVLVAEDSTVALKALKSVMDKIGVNYRTFVNGQLLLDYLNTLDRYDHIGLIITDLEMPVASGFTVIKNLKEDIKTRHIPIVVNSSMSGDSNVNMAKNLNADGFMPKTKPEMIADFVKKFLAK
jgi:two-component system chemotaxis response regulator CheV